MHETISSYENWETLLAPRLVLGLWFVLSCTFALFIYVLTHVLASRHPKFIEPAKKILPYCTRSHIGKSPFVARKHFWDGCDAFSMNFMALQTFEGER